MSNRRRSERFTVALPVTLKDGKGDEHTQTANVSAHGIAVVTAHPRPLRQYLELDLVLPGNPVPISITAVVVRHADKLEFGHGAHAPGLGLELFLFDARGKASWAQFLSELKKNGLDPLPDVSASPPALLESPFDETPTFIIKPRDLGRLWAFYRGEMTKGRVRIETPIIKPVGTRVELLVVHPSSQAEWVLEGSIAATHQNVRGGRPMLEIELEHLTKDPKTEFRNFVATGRGMIEEDVSISLEVPSVVRDALMSEAAAIQQVDLDDDDVALPPTVVAEPSGIQRSAERSRSEAEASGEVISGMTESKPIEEEEFRYESVVIDLDNLGEDQLRSSIVDAPPPLADEDPSTIGPGRRSPHLLFDDEEATLTPHNPEVKLDRSLKEALGPVPRGEPEPSAKRSLFAAFFDEAAQADEERHSLMSAPGSIRVEGRMWPPMERGAGGVGPTPRIDDLDVPKTGIRALPSNGMRPTPGPPPLGEDELFDPPHEGRVVRGAPLSDEPLSLLEQDPVYARMAPEVRGVFGPDDLAKNPPVPLGTEADAPSPEPASRAGSKLPHQLPPSARRRAIKETAGALNASTSHQAVMTEGPDPGLDRDVALARARVVRSPNSVTACYRLGTLLMRRGERDNFDDALSTLLRVMELEPNHPGAHHKLAEVFARRGDYLQASEHLSRARRLGYRTDPDLEAVVANGVKMLERG